MRIVIDMQGTQTQSRNRGIGRYTLALVRELVRQRGAHEIVLVFNAQFEEGLDSLLAEFEQSLGREHLRLWAAGLPTNWLDTANRSRRDLAEQLYESVIASLEPDILLVTSLFEGLSDDAVSSVRRWRQDYPTAVVLYDLIPLIRQAPYFDNPAYARWYAEKIRHIQRADLLLAISDSSRREGLEHLDLPAAHIVNISSACDALFRPLDISAERQQQLAARYGLTRPFIMYTGGVDSRKNIEGLIRAFARLPQALRSACQLAIVCHIPATERVRLERLAAEEGLAPAELVLTDYVPDQHLLELYNLCELFVFPSQHEGFGLPALEAMACGAPVIVANNSSLPEVVGWDQATFDGHDDQAIADKLQQVLGDADFRRQLSEHGRSQAARFSWDTTASLALDALLGRAAEWQAEQAAAAAQQRVDQPLPRLAFVSPLPAERSGISQYSAELLPVLAAHYRIDVFVDQRSIDNRWINQHCAVYPASELPGRAADYDRVLYHFGNSSFHQHMFALLEQVPGVVVLHDFFLSGVINHMDWTGQRPGCWLQTLYASHGYPAVIDRLQQTDGAAVVWRYPANLPVLQQATGVIVHSPYSLQLARRWYGPGAGADWHCIPLLRNTASHGPEPRAQARQSLGIDDADLLVCSFGLLGATKLNHRLLDAWLASSLASDPRALLVFVGEPGNDTYASQLQQRLDAAGAAARIRITGWADDTLYRQYLAAADIGVQLRARSRGETSAAVLDCMNHGLATIVNANGSMADLAAEAVLRLPDHFTDQQLAQALESLATDPALRARLAAAAAQLIHRQHAPERCAEHYQQAIEAGHRRGRNSADGVALSLRQQPSLDSDNAGELCSLAAALDFSFPESPRQPELLLDIGELISLGDAARPLTARLLDHWLAEPPQGYRLEPVWHSAEHGYCYARSWTLGRLGLPAELLADEPVSPRSGDIWMCLEGELADPLWQAHLGHLGVHLARASAEAIGGHREHWFQAITQALPAAPVEPSQAQLLIDVSELVQRDVGTGIQRVVRNILDQWQHQPPAGYRPLPVYARSDRPGYRHACSLLLRRAGLPADLLPDRPVNPLAGDCFLGLDLQPHVVYSQRECYRLWRQQGVTVRFVVYDLLLLHYPHFFREGGQQAFQQWLEVVSEADGLITISRSVADQLQQWLDQRDLPPGMPRSRPRVDWFHLGADLDRSAEPDSATVPAALAGLDLDQPVLLMVGTLEPRKAHQQVLEAMGRLWAEGSAASLVIVGRSGWLVDELVQRLRRHAHAGRQLFWLEGCDDATLQWLYRHASCLLAASVDEGFGLPLIEAARYQLPILARDIPVFREVAGEHASYFVADDPAALTLALRNWLASWKAGSHVSSADLPWLDWQQSAASLARHL